MYKNVNGVKVLMSSEEEQTHIDSLPSSLDILKRGKRDQIVKSYKDSMQSFESAALGSPHTYSADPESQMNLVGCALANVDINFTCDNGTKTKRLHTAVQMNQVFQDGVVHKSTNHDHLSNLLEQIETATIDEIDSIVW